MNSYQQLLLEKGEITEEKAEDFLQLLEEQKEKRVPMDYMKYVCMLSYKMHEYLQALEDSDILTLMKNA
ncbi:MAG: hypothetical protein AB1420_10185 [Bacillota bacterium]